MSREYIIPMGDEKIKTYKVRYNGSKLLVTCVKTKTRDYTIVPGYLNEDNPQIIYEKGWNKAAIIEEIDNEKEKHNIEKYLLKKGLKYPINFWNKKDNFNRE